MTGFITFVNLLSLSYNECNNFQLEQKGINQLYRYTDEVCNEYQSQGQENSSFCSADI
jgi:hypothetical protein